MISRLAKTLLVAASAFFYTLVVFNNLTDYNSNYQFVHHVLLMDSTFPGNHGMWRAIHPLRIHTVFYDSIMAWEVVSMLLMWSLARCNYCVRSARRTRHFRGRNVWRSQG